ncbi:MAG: lysylphosphatidylglycerol synthase transmembrane domain-containing protein [Candidatus Buchananbacteria bacterium]|nr:lysylphosphatidylglycerol synthase transmembrane domain-containing protein [Candidatus Buchananbacteria bacterium]
MIIKKIKKNWYHFIGILIFLYIIFYKIDVFEIGKVIRHVDLKLIILGILLSFIMFLIQAWRWNYLKKIQNINYSFKDSFLIYGSGIYFGTITPGRLGDLIKILYLKEAGHSTGKSAVSVIADRLADLLFLLAIGYLSMLFFAKFFIKEIIIITIIALLVTIATIILKSNLLKNAINRLFSYIIPEKYKKLLTLNIRDMTNDFKAYRFKNYLTLFTVTTIAWFLYYLQMFLLAKSINLGDITFTYLAMSVTIAAIVTLLPISVYGLGTRDATLLFLFSLIGINPEKTITLSILILLVSLFYALIGLICWLKKPLKAKSEI